MIKILAVCGSINTFSLTERSLAIVVEYLQKRHIATNILSLRAYSLPFCDGNNHYPKFPDVERLRFQFMEADAIILASPEYHGSISGVLKNALDLLIGDEMSGKPIALISVMGGAHSTQALSALRLICRHLHALVIPEQLVVAHAPQAFDTHGQFIDLTLTHRLEKMADALVNLSRSLATSIAN